MVVQHNLTAMNANRMLGLTQSSQAKSTEKLSSGYKINRAADDAAGLSISEKMRKQIRGLTQASLNAEDGISAVQTAEGALNEVQDMLQRMNELAVKAANGTMSEDDRNYIQDEVDQLITEIDRVAETTKFNETYLLKGDKNGEKSIDYSYQSADVLKQDVVYLDGTNPVTVKAGTYINALETDVTYYSSGVEGKDVATAFTDATTLKGALTGITVISTDNLYIGVGSDYVKVDEGSEKVTGATYYTVTFGNDGKVGTATVVADPSTAAGYKVGTTAIYDVYGKKVESGTSLGTNPTTAQYFSAVGDGKFDPTDALANFDSVKEPKTVQFTDKDGNEIAENGLYQYFSETGEYKGGLYLQVGEELKPADDADVKALVAQGESKIGSLELNLHVGADATSNNQISLKIEAMDADTLGVADVKVNGTNDENALNAIETVKAAIQKVSTQRSALGAIQNRLEHTINNLDNVVENTTAAESQIRDTDMASEMVKYSNNNILAQAGQAMLAQANQANQGVLSLLG